MSTFKFVNYVFFHICLFNFGHICRRFPIVDVFMLVNATIAISEIGSTTVYVLFTTPHRVYSLGKHPTSDKHQLYGVQQ